MLKTSTGFVMAMSLIGCGSVQTAENPDAGIEVGASVESEVTSPDVIVDPAPSTFAFAISGADGVAAAGDLYATENDAYLRTSGIGSFTGDYVFDVVYFVYPSPETTHLAHASSDPVACRTFHLEAGHITSVAAANDPSCNRSVGADADGNLTVQLMPFDLAHAVMNPTADGNYAYTVRVAPAPLSLNAPEGVFHLGFSVAPEVVPPVAACGNGHLDDGEQCDDGNVVDGDGCSATCAHEEPCGGSSSPDLQ